MPSQEQIAQAATRRAKRKALRAANVEKAHEQERTLTAAVSAGKPKAEPKATPRKSRKEQLAEERRATEAKANEQERKTFVKQDIDVKRYIGSSERVPLHVLNQLSRQVQAPLKQQARDIANAAGKAAYDAASGKRNPTPSAHQRANRMRDAQAAMAKAKAAKSDGTDA